MILCLIGIGLKTLIGLSRSGGITEPPPNKLECDTSAIQLMLMTTDDKNA